MAVEDKTLVCSDCGEEFIFTAEEQEFYIEKGFENEPKRCKPCRQQRKSQRSGRSFGRQRETYTATCADCGGVAEVPFKPREDRPVYCRECYQKRR
ncbi:MAG: zinc-ribbon domain containing protein [Candidatus Hydrothermarchaeales archaeon]